MPMVPEMVEIAVQDANVLQDHVVRTWIILDVALTRSALAGTMERDAVVVSVIAGAQPVMVVEVGTPWQEVSGRGVDVMVGSLRMFPERPEARREKNAVQEEVREGREKGMKVDERDDLMKALIVAMRRDREDKAMAQVELI